MYWSQVTDVVAHLNTLGPVRVRLVALVSARDYLHTRRRIKARSADAMVLPMVPQMKRWRSNATIINWVCRKLRPTGIIARGGMATWLAQQAREKGLVERVCFDGRGAYAAEWEEYRIINDEDLIAQFRPTEEQAVLQSDFRIAVSNALVAHWRERYGYAADDHVVIPCTLGSDHFNHRSVGDHDLNDGQERPVTLVYSGSTAGWQSFQLLEELLTPVLDQQERVHVLFLSREDDNNRRLADRYPGRVEVKWVRPEQVSNVLAACDHGILVRENTITNQVASPTKFAEYLAAGLSVIISEGLGDFSGMVSEYDLGLLVGPGGTLPELAPVTPQERTRAASFAREHFSKQAYNDQYASVLAALGRGRVDVRRSLAGL